MDNLNKIKNAIRDVPDFPKEGILFKDITPLLNDNHLFKKTIDILAEDITMYNIDYIAGIESRGFIFASALAIHQDAIPEGASVVLVDDLLATGGTALAAVKLLEQCSAKIELVQFLIELTFLKGNSKLKAYNCNALIKY